MCQPKSDFKSGDWSPPGWAGRDQMMRLLQLRRPRAENWGVCVCQEVPSTKNTQEINIVGTNKIIGAY